MKHWDFISVEAHINAFHALFEYKSVSLIYIFCCERLHLGRKTLYFLALYVSIEWIPPMFFKTVLCGTFNTYWSARTEHEEDLSYTVRCEKPTAMLVISDNTLHH